LRQSEVNVQIYFSDPVVNIDSQERATITRLLQKLILEDDQFDVRDILPNTLPDPASLNLESDYACPIGQVVSAPDCGTYLKITDHKTIYFHLQIQILKIFCIILV
jgi:hypothetical protein